MRNISCASPSGASSTHHRLGAAEIAAARGGRKTPRGFSCFCPTPAHQHSKKRHLDISEGANGKPLLICRAGCSQAEVLDSLRALGLWPESSGSWRPSRPRFSWLDHVSSRPEPAISPCCLEVQPCEHRKQFEFEMLVANMMSNVADAIDEVRTKYDRAGRALAASTLRGEIEFSIGFGGIAPNGLPDDAVAEVLDHVIGNDAPPQDFIPLVVEMAEVLEEVDG